MAINIYEPCANPITGEIFRAISFSKEVFTMQWTVQPNGYVPFEHIHYNQKEVFHVIKGEMRVVINGKEYITQEGETMIIPKGMAHIAYNNKSELLDCVVEYKPGLDHDKFMQCIVGLTQDRFIDRKGAIDIPRMGYFLKKMNAKCMARPTEIPASIFNIALLFFYIRGVFSGWSTLYKKYTT